LKLYVRIKKSNKITFCNLRFFVNLKTFTKNSSVLYLFTCCSAFELKTFKLNKGLCNMNRRIKRYILSLFTLCILTFLSLNIFLSTFSAAQTSLDRKGLDVIAVIDASGSMGSSPENGNLANVGTRILIPGLETLIDVGKARQYPVNMGVVIFNDKAVRVSDNLWTLTDGIKTNSKIAEDLKLQINKLYKASGNTNQPDAILTAINLLLEQGNEKNAKLIVLFTDGANRGNTEKYFSDQQKKAISYAKNGKIMISTIGFSPTDDDLGRLEDYSKSTGGLTSVLRNEDKITEKVIESFFGQIGIGGNTGQKEEVDIIIKVPETMLVYENGKQESKPVVGFTIVFDSDNVTNITLESLSENKVLLKENDNDSRIKTERSNHATIVTIGDVTWDKFPTGEWRLTAYQPINTDANYYWIPDVGIPNPLIGDDPIPEPVTETETTETTTVTTATTETTTSVITTDTPPVTVTDTDNSTEPIVNDKDGESVIIPIVVLIVTALVAIIILLYTFSKKTKNVFPSKTKIKISGNVNVDDESSLDFESNEKELEGDYCKLSDLGITNCVINTIGRIIVENEVKEKAKEKAEKYLNSVKLKAIDDNKISMKGKGGKSYEINAPSDEADFDFDFEVVDHTGNLKKITIKLIIKINYQTELLYSV